MDALRSQGLIGAIGISINRWEPWNGVQAARSGLIDAVQVIYNIFDQNPEDELFPVCQELKVAIIARVPFDEGSLTGALTRETTFPQGDWRALYFKGDNLRETIDRVDRLRPVVPPGMTMPELALRFILQHPAVTTTIPGMRRVANVERNLSASDGQPLPDGLYRALRAHRWVRTTTIP
jgi:aryl-alcohol dehydrogenase-like predicted oxidoreductase